MKPIISINTIGDVQSLKVQFSQDSKRLSGGMLNHFALHMILRIDGVPWSEVKDFDDCKSDDPVYVLNPETGTVTFGDGMHGRRLPENIQRISANYRIGGGVSGDSSEENKQGDSESYLVYADIWSRDVTAMEDTQLTESALGGTDTSTRDKKRHKIGHPFKRGTK